MRCRLCGAERLSLFYTQGRRGEFRFYRCPVCRLVNYDLDGGLDQEKYAREFVDPLDADPAVNRAQTMTYRFFRRHVTPPGRLLEIGCGNGRLLHLARQDGWSVRGLELSPFLAESVRRRLDVAVEVADFLDYGVRDGERYDAVLLRHVLEHLPDARRAMERIRALLAEGKHAYLEIPNIDALDLRFKRWLQLRGWHTHAWLETYRPGHCNEYCRASFEYLLAQTGFALVIWQTYSHRPVRNWLFNRLPIGNKARALIRRL